MVYLILALTVLLIILIVYAYCLNKDIKMIALQLKTIRENESINNVTTETFNRNASELLKQVNFTLESANLIKAQLAKSDREKKQMISNVSHDLKTPLTSAFGYLQLINNENTDQKKMLEYIDLSEIKLMELKKLIDDFSGLSKISEDSYFIEKSKINVSTLLVDTINLYLGDFKQKGMEVKLDITTDIYVEGDSKALKQVFQNLVGNALVHGINIFEVQLEDKKIRFINEFNPSIHFEIDRIFDRFYTIDLSRNSKSSGLGLAIVKEVIEKLEGKVNAQVDHNRLIITIDFSK